jgi:hypothetical protein
LHRSGIGIRADERNWHECVELRSKAIVARRKIIEMYPSKAGFRDYLGGDLTSLASALREVRRFDEAFSAVEESKVILDTAIRRNPDRSELVSLLSDNRLTAGQIYVDLKRLQEAANVLEHAAGEARRVVAWEPGNQTNKRRLALALSWLVLARAGLGTPRSALERMARESVAIAEAAVNADPANKRSSTELAEIEARVRPWL